MLGIPGGAVLVKALFFLRAAIFRTLPCAGKQGKVRFGRTALGNDTFWPPTPCASLIEPASISDFG